MRVIKHIIIFLVIYIPFEDFFWSIVGFQGVAFLLIRQLFDFIVLFLFLGTMAINRRHYRTIGRGIDKYIFFFLIYVLVLSLTSSSNYFNSVAQIKALLRYIPLVYIILNVKADERFIRKVFEVISVIFLIQLLIGLIQIIGGPSVMKFFMVGESRTSVLGHEQFFTSIKESGKGFISGTMGNNISYSFFLIVGYCTYVKHSKKYSWNLFISVFTLFIVYYSGSRIGTITIFLVIVWVLFGHRLVQKGFVKSSISLSAILAILIIPIFLWGESYVGEIFSDDYLYAARRQRLGVILFVLPVILFSRNIFWGFSPDADAIANYVSSNLIQASPILDDHIAILLEDVYWVGLLAYYGIIGLALWLAYLGRVFFFLKKYKNQVTEISLIFLLVSIMLNFINQAFEVRQFSFFLWLFIGIAISKNKYISKLWKSLA